MFMDITPIIISIIGIIYNDVLSDIKNGLNSVLTDVYRIFQISVVG